MESVEELGKRGYEKQMWGAYDEAVTIYTSAIRKFPKDPRFFNNRCLCYLELNDYKKALEDAEHMILSFPTYKKSYFRKGEILFKMKNFEESEIFFRQVLNLDPECEEAKIQAKEAQVALICKGLKVSKAEAHRALNYAGNVEDARNALRCRTLESRFKELEEIIYMSDGEDCPPTVRNGVREEYDPLMDPSNPYRSLSLWVGYVTKGVSESYLTNLFSKYGRVKSVKILIDKDKLSGYAFVNFYDTDGPGKAMKHLQGFLVEGQRIFIKYPDNVKVASSSSKFK